MELDKKTEYQNKVQQDTYQKLITNQRERERARKRKFTFHINIKSFNLDIENKQRERISINNGLKMSINTDLKNQNEQTQQLLDEEKSKRKMICQRMQDQRNRMKQLQSSIYSFVNFINYRCAEYKDKSKQIPIYNQNESD